MSCSKGQKLNTLYNFKKIFIGHTPTLYFNSFHPINKGGVMNVDTGSGKGGVLTIMNIDTEEYWQSEFPEKLKKYVIINENKENSTEEEDSKGEEVEISEEKNI